MARGRSSVRELVRKVHAAAAALLSRMVIRPMHATATVLLVVAALTATTLAQIAPSEPSPRLSPQVLTDGLATPATVHLAAAVPGTGAAPGSVVASSAGAATGIATVATAGAALPAEPANAANPANPAVSTAAQGLPPIQRVHPHQVVSGDTLSGLAARFGITLDTIISFNDIKRARDLRVGRELTIPAASGVRYEVRRGDSLSGIAVRHGVDLSTVLAANAVQGELITPGQVLMIPGGRLGENELNRVLGRLFVWPARGRLTSGYGYRNDPFTGIRKFHNGIDIANAQDTAVVTAMGGSVAMLGYNGNYGRYLIIRHQDGFQTLYAHLHKIVVERGQRVRQGQRVGSMGTTGYSTASHLHFSIFQHGRHVNPVKHLD